MAHHSKKKKKTMEALQNRRFYFEVPSLWPNYLSMKEGSLFCFVVMKSTWDASDRVLGVFGKLWLRRGAWAWFHDVWTCGAKFLNIE
jgi:hypothetical protein